MRTMIAKLKRNIYEVKQDRDKVVKEISKTKKIHNNLERMCEIAASDNAKIKRDFEAEMIKNQTISADKHNNTDFLNKTIGTMSNLNMSTLSRK